MIKMGSHDQDGGHMITLQSVRVLPNELVSLIEAYCSI